MNARSSTGAARLGVGALAWLGVFPLAFGCGGPSGPPRHPVAEMSARATAKIGLIDLVVEDAARAQRLRQLYLNVVALGQEFDVERARALLRARALAGEHAGQTEPSGPDALEQLLAPPLAQSRAAFERYAELMLEARSLLTEAEFERLNRVR